MIYSKFSGNSASVNIENVDGREPYTCIGTKAFLSCKNVYEIHLPETICEVGPWAFAHMKDLKRIMVPAKKILIGKDAFLDCDSLREVVVYPGKADDQGISYLMASCITVLKAYDLLDFQMAAEQTESWCEMYDRKLKSYICQADDAEFQPVMVGWFNDEGEDEQRQRYINVINSNKIKLSFLRLKYDVHIDNDMRQTLLSYLKEQINRLENGDDFAWNDIKEVLQDDIQYVKITVGNSLINEELILDLITFLNDKNASAEIVAYLVSSVNNENKDADSQFDL